MLVLLVPVVFTLMGFAVDLGRLYLVRHELKVAGDAMALAAAGKLIGTETALDNATEAAELTLNNTEGFGNKYNFGTILIGQSSSFLTSEPPQPAYFETLADATGSEGASGAEGSGTNSKYVRVTVRAEAPLLFWSFLPLVENRKTVAAASSVAGISAPLCTACGIEPFAIAALDASDAAHFGFTPNTKYTFGYVCNGAPTPPSLPGATQRLPYLLLDRYDAEAEIFPEETTQAYRVGAQGLPPSSTEARACISINAEEVRWVSAAPPNCNQGRVNAVITAAMCGLASRFETTIPSGCESIPEVDSLSTAYTPDSDLTDLDDYTAYAGAARRVITVPIVETLSATGTMLVLGFRQFLVEPNQNSTNINAGDQNGRFAALYLGNPVPLRQGRFNGCQVTAGPGKVVLHQ